MKQLRDQRISGAGYLGARFRAIVLAANAVLVASILFGPTLRAEAEGVVPVEGGWVGLSSAGGPVYLHVAAGEVVDVHFAFKWGFCGDHYSDNSNEAAIGAAGTWSYLDPNGPRIEGTFVGPEALEGTIVAPSRDFPGCPETVATFTASPGVVPPPPKPKHFKDYAVDSFSPSHHSARPKRIVLDFYDVERLYDLHWKNFGGPVAHASGRVLINGVHRYFRPHVAIRLSNAILNEGERYKEYSFLRMKVSGPVPHGFPRVLLFWMLGHKAEYPP